jgi:hypothetical protein
MQGQHTGSGPPHKPNLWGQTGPRRDQYQNNYHYQYYNEAQQDYYREEFCIEEALFRTLADNRRLRHLMETSISNQNRLESMVCGLMDKIDLLEKSWVNNQNIDPLKNINAINAANINEMQATKNGYPIRNAHATPIPIKNVRGNAIYREHPATQNGSKQVAAQSAAIYPERGATQTQRAMNTTESTCRANVKSNTQFYIDCRARLYEDKKRRGSCMSRGSCVIEEVEGDLVTSGEPIKYQELAGDKSLNYGLARQFKEQAGPPPNLETMKIEIGSVIGQRLPDETSLYSIITKQSSFAKIAENREEFITQALRGIDGLANHIAEGGFKTVALPYICSGRERLDWIFVKDLLLEKLQNYDVTLRIYNRSPKTTNRRPYSAAPLAKQNQPTPKILQASQETMASNVAPDTMKNTPTMHTAEVNTPPAPSDPATDTTKDTPPMVESTVTNPPEAEISATTSATTLQYCEVVNNKKQQPPSTAPLPSELELNSPIPRNATTAPQNPSNNNKKKKGNNKNRSG